MLADPLQLGMKVGNLGVEVEAYVTGGGSPDRQSRRLGREADDDLLAAGVAEDDEGVPAPLGIHPRLELPRGLR